MVLQSGNFAQSFFFFFFIVQLLSHELGRRAVYLCTEFNSQSLSVYSVGRTKYTRAKNVPQICADWQTYAYTFYRNMRYLIYNDRTIRSLRRKHPKTSLKITLRDSPILRHDRIRMYFVRGISDVS